MTPAGGVKSPHILQIVLGSDNLSLAKHLYSTVFGFAGTGERLVYSQCGFAPEPARWWRPPAQDAPAFAAQPGSRARVAEIY